MQFLGKVRFVEPLTGIPAVAAVLPPEACL